jgi:uncharacterized protein with beta-barrel porin domain
MAGRIFDGFAGGVMAKGGAKMTQRIEVANGAVKPSLSVGWAHEFTNPHTTVRESFAAIPGSGFTLTGGSTGNDLALLGAGVSYDTTQRWSVFAVTTRRSAGAPPTTRSALVSE